MFEIQLTNIIDKNFTYLNELTEKATSVKKSQDKWTQKEILGHLIDSANVNHNRFLNGINKRDLIFDTYPQNDWVEYQNYNDRAWGDLIELWARLNLHIAKLIGQIPKEVISRMTKNHNFNQICWKEVSQNQETSLSYLIKDYIGHLEHHLNQILDY